MNITYISDTHCAQPGLPGGDLLIHAGDLTYQGRTKETKKQLDYLARSLDLYKNIVIVPGNHEVDWDKGRVPFRRYCEERGITVLVDQAVVIDGVKIYGTPTTPEFCGWAYMRGPEDIVATWECIPEDTDILITHGPPRGILDSNLEGQECGCPSLLVKVKQIKPKIHVFGHIHEAHGLRFEDDTTFINASIMNRQYEPVNSPTTLEY